MCDRWESLEEELVVPGERKDMSSTAAWAAVKDLSIQTVAMWNPTFVTCWSVRLGYVITSENWQ